MKYLFILSGWICLTTSTTVQAQNTNSVYSVYGIGDVGVRGWNAYSAMGGLGVALKSERTLNDLNPASYGGIKYNKFMLEVAATGTSMHYITANDNLSGSDFGVKRAALGMNLFDNLGTVIGFKQYTNVGYKSTALKEVSGTSNALNETITGSGGINMAYIGNGYNFGKHLSVGVTTGFLFGSIKKNEQIILSDASGLNIDNNSFYNKFYFNTGVQYQFATGKYKWILGASFQPEFQLRKEESFEVKDFNDSVFTSSTTTGNKFQYPMQLGAGITLMKGNSTFGADCIQQNWSSTNYRGAGFTTTNSQNFALGYSYTFRKKAYYGMRDLLTLMAGFQRDLSYIIINGKQVNSTIGSLGANIPSKNGLYNYTVGLRFGQRGQVSYPLVKEKFVDLTFNISLTNILNRGGRKYD